MTIYSGGDDDRQVIPRWRSYRSTVLCGELQSTGRTSSHAETGPENRDFVGVKLRDFSENKKIPFAAELLGAAIVENRISAASEAIEFLLGCITDLPPSLRRVVEAIGKGEETDIGAFPLAEDLERQALIQEVRHFKNYLRSESRDAIAWVELSRAYTLLANKEKAEVCMDIAVSLARENRFALRSASRLFVHLDALEKAHSILRKSNVRTTDPWVLSAEIAVAEANDRRSKNIKKARQMLEGGDFTDWQIAELAGALGTVEINHGNQRKGRALVRRSLTDPTENTVAQAAWLAKKDTNVRPPQSALQIVNAFEARAWSSALDKNWSSSVDSVKKWQQDQPFSSRPADLGTFVSSVALQDFHLATELAKAGLRCNPDDFTLTNNLVFSLANEGKVKESLEIFEKLNVNELESENRIVYAATAGLLAFRLGFANHGRKLYRAAIESGRRTGRRKTAALAAMFYAFEELALDEIETQSVVDEALSMLEGVAIPEAEGLQRKLKEKEPMVKLEKTSFGLLDRYSRIFDLDESTLPE